MYSFDMTILKGLPVTISYEVEPAEPDNGIENDFVGDWWITAVNNIPCNTCEWLNRRIKESKDEELRIVRKCIEDYNDAKEHDRNL